MKRNRKNISQKPPFWFYIILGLLPIVFVVILELLLTFFNYGNDYSVFIRLPENFPNYKFFNPKLPEKYFGNSPVIPSVIPDGFQNEKRKNTFRIFTLGGSTTAGFPHSPNGSFPRQLKNLLSETYPKVSFEVINLGVSAVNSVTMRDIIDDVLLENPDLIIIYSGHNEYYGALGSASTIRGISSPIITNLYLNLKKFRVVQLVEYAIQNILSLFANKHENSGTLMREMAGDNLVPKGSDEYYKGIEQFEDNVETILKKCKDKNIPVLLGRIASNLMQRPLCRLSGCDSLVKEFDEITKSLDSNDVQKLYSIKDSDALRFRAPEEINTVIDKLAKKYDYELFDVEGLFENFSNNKIIGFNLMMDHLHPTYSANKLIAKLLLNKINSLKYIEESIHFANKFDFHNFSNLKTYSSLDSSLAELRVKYLENDFPFRGKNERKKIELKSREDSLSARVINGQLSWESAHEILAKEYLKEGDLLGYSTEMNVLIEDKPFVENTYKRVIYTLEKVKNEKYLVQFLMKYFKKFPKGNTAKKIANIYRGVGNLSASKYFYEVVLEFIPNDPEVFFNLSAIYYSRGETQKALEFISKCIEVDPNFPNAQKIYYSLKRSDK